MLMNSLLFLIEISHRVQVEHKPVITTREAPIALATSMLTSPIGPGAQRMLCLLYICFVACCMHKVCVVDRLMLSTQYSIVPWTGKHMICIEVLRNILYTVGVKDEKKCCKQRSVTYKLEGGNSKRKKTCHKNQNIIKVIFIA